MGVLGECIYIHYQLMKCNWPTTGESTAKTEHEDCRCPWEQKAKPPLEELVQHKRLDLNSVQMLNCHLKSISSVDGGSFREDSANSNFKLRHLTFSAASNSVTQVVSIHCNLFIT